MILKRINGGKNFRNNRIFRLENLFKKRLFVSKQIVFLLNYVNNDKREGTYNENGQRIRD